MFDVSYNLFLYLIQDDDMKKLFLLSFIFLTSSAFALTAGIEGHAAGDVIAVKTNDQVAAFCNFDKTILMTNTDVLCVYNGRKN